MMESNFLKMNKIIFFIVAFEKFMSAYLFQIAWENHLIAY